jgi:hypothetical protein
MQDPDRRDRRARCAALIQDCRVHEWSWNAPSLFSKHQTVAPRRSRAASSPEAVVSVRLSAPVAPLSSIFLLAFVGQLGAPAYRSSQPSAPYGTDQHQHERSNYDPDQRVLWQWWWSRRIAHSVTCIPNEAQGVDGLKSNTTACWHHLPACCGRVARSRLIRGSTTLRS